MRERPVFLEVPPQTPRLPKDVLIPGDVVLPFVVREPAALLGAGVWFEARCGSGGRGRGGGGAPRGRPKEGPREPGLQRARAPARLPSPWGWGREQQCAFSLQSSTRCA